MEWIQMNHFNADLMLYLYVKKYMLSLYYTKRTVISSALILLILLSYHKNHIEEYTILERTLAALILHYFTISYYVANTKLSNE